ncbi:hypothetical protein DL770_003667 [Monosporascus sp. CRB-9-2]|nr:hypothetical protein DL770_003667 [Monosporascus sp. CRB-9-2]
MSSSRKLVVGIDFGTTFSGVAWLFYNGTKAPADPQIITRWLSTHARNTIEKAKGPSLIKAAPIHVVLTVPAIYQDYGRERMRRAAELAGILDKRPLCDDTTLSFVTEPESAVIATLPELDYRGDLEPNDTFVLCDCGGGTVDIISYMVVQKSPLVIRECVEGDVNGNTVSNAISTAQIGPGFWTSQSEANEANWKSHRRSQKLPLTPIQPTKETILIISRSEIRGVFSNVTTRIKDLVGNQVQAIKKKTSKNPKFVILAGGFGRCPFIYASLREQYQGVTEVLQSDGERPWSAICRGAAMYGALGHGLTDDGVRVQSRVSRLSYGWKHNAHFIKGEHLIEDKLWDELGGYYVAANQMQWAIKRGDDVETSHAKTFPYCRKYYMWEIGKQVGCDDIYTSTKSDPTSRFGSGYELPLLTSIKWETPFRVEELPVKRRLRRAYRQFDFEYQMEVSGASLDLRIVADGKVLGAKSLQVKTD